jgi:hypothetical protein
MNYNLIEDMRNALNENNLGKARSILVNSLLAFEDGETIDMLNKMALENGVFEDDNGKYSSSKNDKETAADTKEKFEIKTIFQKGKKWDTKKKAAAATVGLAALAFGVKLFANRKSKKK